MMNVVFMAVTVTATSAYSYFPTEIPGMYIPNSVSTDAHFSVGHTPPAVEYPIRKYNRNLTLYGRKAMFTREFNEECKKDRNCRGWKDRSKYRTQKRKNHPAGYGS